ncbi:MAG: CHRD domain-containing protein, partial [Comamonadaceae bacterium]
SMRLSLSPCRAALLAGAVLLGLSGCAPFSPALSGEHVFEAALEGRQEVPPVATAATGQARLHYDSRSQVLDWSVSHSGVDGRVTAAHLHGPAGPGQVAAIVIPLSGNLDAPPIRGRLRITPEQFEQLRSGQWYVDLHTRQHPQGELRGQLRHSAD